MNTLDYSGYAGPVQVDLINHTATGVSDGISNIQNVIYPIKPVGFVRSVNFANATFAIALDKFGDVWTANRATLNQISEYSN